MDLQVHSDLDAIIRMLPAFGKYSHVVMGYCYLFGISPLGLKTKKLRILLDEMKVLFERQAFNYQKKKYSITQAGIAEALNVMVHRNFNDLLVNHNYLKMIMIGISERETAFAGKQAERDLRKKEDRLRYPFSEERVEVPGQMSPDVRDQVDKMLGRKK